MKKIFYKKIGKLFIFLAFIGLGLFLVLINFKDFKKTETAFADLNDNVFGYAWSENIGWISFNNCTDQNEPISCDINDYGLYIDSTNQRFFGYAWSSNLGWISFESNKTIGDTTNITSHCPSCNPSSGCTACISGTNVYGWAKILSLGDEGWIRLDDDNTGDAINYGVSVNNGNFSGFAWNANDNGHGIGWISFNSDSDGSAPPSYKVFYNNRPNVINLDAPDQTEFEACTTILNANLTWELEDDDGDTQASYQIIFDDEPIILDANNNPINPPLLNTGQCTGVGIPNDDCLIAGSANRFPIYNIDDITLDYGVTYYWKVRVWDSKGGRSAYASDDFIIDTHERPDIVFSFFPNSPSAGENTLFISAGSQYHSTDDIGIDCDDTHCLYEWSGTGTISSPSASSTYILFNNPSSLLTPNSVKLRITDADNPLHTCESDPRLIQVKKKLPKWIEAK